MQHSPSLMLRDLRPSLDASLDPSTRVRSQDLSWRPVHQLRWELAQIGMQESRYLRGIEGQSDGAQGVVHVRRDCGICKNVIVLNPRSELCLGRSKVYGGGVNDSCRRERERERERERRGQGRARHAVIAEVEQGEKHEICSTRIATEDYARSRDTRG
jgi:hypothetical protein